MVDLNSIAQRRDRLAIIAEVLIITRYGALRTRIMYKGNLSFAQLQTYVTLLQKSGLLEIEKVKGKTFYNTTQKGLKFLQNYEDLLSMLNSYIEIKKNPHVGEQPVFWVRKP